MRFFLAPISLFAKAMRCSSTSAPFSLRMMSSTSSQPHHVSVVSTGSRGIGLEFVTQLLQQQSGNVIALCRTPTAALLSLKAEYPTRLDLIENVDLECPDSIGNAGDAVKSKFDRVDLLLNVAAILGDGKTEGEGPERALEKISASWLSKSMTLNLMGHVLMTQALYPLLIAASKQSRSGDINSNSRPKVVNLSARVGSISDNQLGGWYSYRMSKAALNQFTKTLSIESKRHKICVISIHPGTTDTDLSKPFQQRVKPEKLFSVQYSVSSMLTVVKSAGLNESGKFFAYDGSEIEY